jgi:hypothetical protein
MNNLKLNKDVLTVSKILVTARKIQNATKYGKGNWIIPIIK